MSYLGFYEDYKDKIFSYFYYNLEKDKSLAEDLTSETFTKGFEKFDSYNSEYEFSTWIFTIARNTLTDHFRKNKNNTKLDIDFEELSETEALKYEQDFNSKIDTDIAMKEAKDALYTLKTEHKDIIVMKYLSDFSNKEISGITGKSEGNIRKIISRGLQVILKNLKSKNIDYEKV